MKAVLVREWSEPPHFVFEDIATPSPADGELLVAVHTAAISFGDTLIASGRYQVRPKLPFTAGAEFSGVVAAVGKGVKDYEIGDRVAAFGFIGNSRANHAIMGSCAQMAIVPIRNAIRVPASVDLETAALFRSSAETSCYALQEGRLKAGDTLLVLGAGGGTGHAAVMLGKLMGARVIASASSPAKRQIAMDAGADIAIDSNAGDWRGQLEAFVGHGGINVVYDPVGGNHSERAFRTLGYQGRHLVVGFAAGSIPNLPLNLPLMKAASVVGANLLVGWEKEPERIAENAKYLMNLLGQGKLSTPPIARRYPLAQTGEAMRDVASGKMAGRVVISISPRTDAAGSGANAADAVSNEALG